eukprot:3938394-Rhodomonas_salina.2
MRQVALLDPQVDQAKELAEVERTVLIEINLAEDLGELRLVLEVGLRQIALYRLEHQLASVIRIEHRKPVLQHLERFIEQRWKSLVSRLGDIGDLRHLSLPHCACLLVMLALLLLFPLESSVYIWA